MQTSVSVVPQASTRHDLVTRSGMLRASTSRGILPNEASHSDASTSKLSSSRPTTAPSESRLRRIAASSNAVEQRPSSSTSRRKHHKRGTSSSSTRRQQSQSQEASTTPPKGLPTKLHLKKPIVERKADGTSCTSPDIPNATPPSPRLPYFAMYPSRADRLRTPDASPYHSEDTDSLERSRLRGKAMKSGAYSDGGGTSSLSSRSRTRAYRPGESDTTENQYAWPAKVTSSKLRDLLQVPSPASSSKSPDRSSTSSVTPSPMSSLSSSPSRGVDDTMPPSPPSTSWQNSHSTNNTSHMIPSYGPYGRHKFPSIRDPPDSVTLQRSINSAAKSGDGTLFVAPDFDVSAMDALVASINGGEERSYGGLADLVHLSTSVWPPSKSEKRTQSSKTTPSTFLSSSSRHLHHPHPRHTSKQTPDASTSRHRTPQTVSPIRQSTSPPPVPSSLSSRPSIADAIVQPNKAYSLYSPKSAPSLSRSSGVSSDVSSLSTPVTDRNVVDWPIPQTGLSTRPGPPGEKSVDSLTSGKTVVPSIADIIRTYAPDQLKLPAGLPPRSPILSSSSTIALTNSTNSRFSRSLMKNSSTPVADIVEESESRSSIDSVAEEALRSITSPSATIKVAQASSPTGSGSTPSSPTMAPMTPTPRSSNKFTYSDVITSPSEMSFGSHGGMASAMRSVPPSPLPARSSSPTQEMARYLRSPRLTKLIKLRRGANAGIVVSVADVGSPVGHPVLLFLGLGCVRYIIGLYDEMAEALGIRLICMDRWGLGRTTEVPEDKRGMLEWAAVVEEVMESLKIKKFSILAHSAGAPYALACALKLGDHVHGSIHLLAPWVSQSVDGGYKWLKYMPASLIKTAQTAEWKMQGWKIGKPPTLPWEGIGFDAKSMSPPGSFKAASLSEFTDPTATQRSTSPITLKSQPSTNSSEYDDLADFAGRFASSVTLAHPNGAPVVKKKGSFLGLFDGRQRRQASVSNTSPITSRSEFAQNAAGAELRNSQSKSSLRTKSSLKLGKKNKSTPTPSPVDTTSSFSSDRGLPPLPAEADLILPGVAFDFPSFDSPEALDDWDFTLRGNSKALAAASNASGGIDRANGRRSHSLSPSPLSRPSAVGREKLRLPPLPSFSMNMDIQPPSPTFSQASQTPSLSARSHGSAKSSPYATTYGSVANVFGGTSPGGTMPAKKNGGTQKPVISLASALMRASHAEALKGGTADLLAILERPGARPWGFSYTDVRQHVKVWYGDKDERIGMGTVKWMEKMMKDCEVKILKGEGHGLLTNAEVVVEALESIAAEWKR